MQTAEYQKASADVATLPQLIATENQEVTDERFRQNMLVEEVHKTQGFLFNLKSADKKQAELQNIQNERDAIAREEADIQQKDTMIKDLIQKKSIMDRMVKYYDDYVSLTGLGVVTLSDLNVRNYRVSDDEFSDFIAERSATFVELRSIADRASFEVSNLRSYYADADTSQLWSVAIGLGKLQGDQYQIIDRFLQALRSLQRIDSQIENKLMAAEIMTSFKARPNQTMTDNSDIPDLSQSLMSLDHDVRHRGDVPNEISVGVAATILSGRKYDGTYPLDRFLQFNKMTKSYETAAILSILNVPSDQIFTKFQSFRSLFSSWGYEMSEDTELSSAYLALSDMQPDDVRTKMVILLQSLHNYLEYPIVAAAILASIPSLEANETLDLMEKAFTMLSAFAQGLERSELVSLAVRMIHGIKNELVKELDPTATLANTPVQFTYAPTWGYFIYHRPLIITHSRYYSTFSGIGGAHPAHVHGYGGGGFGG